MLGWRRWACRLPRGAWMRGVGGGWRLGRGYPCPWARPTVSAHSWPTSPRTFSAAGEGAFLRSGRRRRGRRSRRRHPCRGSRREGGPSRLGTTSWGGGAALGSPPAP
eukprot:554477-Pyramimonas_sp.AAC.1